MSVHAVLADLHGIIASLLPNHVQLTIQLDKQVAYAELDRQGLDRLLSVGRDAMPNGDRLTIEVKTIDGFSKSNRPLSIESAFHQILIQISDTGTGMNLDTQAHMFEPLFSRKETNIGLGLTAVFGIVKQNGGTLEVDSRPGQGTVVQIVFPAVHRRRHGKK